MLLNAGIATATERQAEQTKLLWLNLASDPLPALALGLEPPDPDVLDEPPHDPRVPILDRADFRRILREGAVLGTSALAGYLLAGGATGAAQARTIVFHGLTLSQIVHKPVLSLGDARDRGDPSPTA